MNAAHFQSLCSMASDSNSLSMSWAVVLAAAICAIGRVSVAIISQFGRVGAVLCYGLRDWLVERNRESTAQALASQYSCLGPHKIRVGETPEVEFTGEVAKIAPDDKGHPGPHPVLTPPTPRR